MAGRFSREGIALAKRRVGFTGKHRGPRRGKVQRARATLLQWEEAGFQAAIQDYIRTTGEEVTGLVARLAWTLLGKVIARTPVGEASQWANPERAPQGYVGGTAKRGWHISDEKYIGDHPYAVISNAVFYIVFLEFGWSRQAPEGMLRISMRELRNEMRAKLRAIAKQRRGHSALTNAI